MTHLEVELPNLEQPIQHQAGHSPKKLTPYRFRIGLMVVLAVVLVSFLLSNLWQINREIDLREKKIMMEAALTPPPQTTADAEPTYIPTPTIPVVQYDPAVVINPVGPGLFFPTSEGQTTNNNRPTLIGVVKQGANANEQYLPTKLKTYSDGEWAWRDDTQYVEFVPGSVNDNLSVLIDGKKVNSVYGFPQYPMIFCSAEKIDVDPNNCLQENSAEIPPLVFLVKPTSALARGPHTLEVQTTTGEIKKMNFMVDGQYQLLTQSVYDVSDEQIGPYEYFPNSDSCERGFTYDSNYLPVPLAGLDNDKLFYSVYFSKEDEAVAAKTNKEIFLQFDNQQFNFFLPNSNQLRATKILLGTDEVWRYSPIYLPMKHVVSRNGTSVLPSQVRDVASCSDCMSDYIEVMPVDLIGRKYLEYPLPMSYSSFSGCDG